MTKAEAYQLLLTRLSSATEEQARNVNVILERGAGCLPLPDGAVMTGPTELPPDRRHAYCNLVDGLRYLSVDGNQYVPVHAGAWEAVLATLVIEEQWDTIAGTAADLLREE